MTDVLGKDGWYSFATRRPGPASKVYAETNRRMGWVGHSMEGWWATNDTLDDPDRGSWAGTILITGELKQHYSTLSCPWASGSKEANTRFVAWELEGLAGTPMNNAQLATALRMKRCWEDAGLPLLVGGQTMFDHNQVATRWQPNNGGTSCPSNRWAPFYAALLEEEEMADPRIDLLMVAVFGDKAEQEIVRLQLLGVANLEDRVASLEANGDTSAREQIKGHIEGHSAYASAKTGEFEITGKVKLK